MKYKRFEDLPVWNAAIDLAVAIYALTSKPEFAPHPGLRDQLERASVSVSNNIAEGFEAWQQQGAVNVPLHFARLSRRGSIDALFTRAPAVVRQIDRGG